MEKKDDRPTKEKILMATLELAAEKGLGEVSLSQIAKKVGIQKPSLYNHFSSKDEIIMSLYQSLRDQAKSNVGSVRTDYGEWVKGKSAVEVLKQTVHSYRAMNQDPNMSLFYKFIMSERSLRKEAAAIMVVETERMILATKQLFYAMQVQNVLHFKNIDMAAFTFAMAIHSIMDYNCDQRLAEVTVTAESLLDEFLTDFCRIYGGKA